jgi:hypothetical protein
MDGNPPVPASPGGRSDAPTVIGAGCAQILLPGEGKRPTIALITPSIWGMSVEAAQRIAGHADSRTTKLYNRRGQKVLLEDMERIRY